MSGPAAAPPHDLPSPLPDSRRLYIRGGLASFQFIIKSVRCLFQMQWPCSCALHVYTLANRGWKMFHLILPAMVLYGLTAAEIDMFTSVVCLVCTMLMIMMVWSLWYLYRV